MAAKEELKVHAYVMLTGPKAQTYEVLTEPSEEVTDGNTNLVPLAPEVVATLTVAVEL